MNRIDPIAKLEEIKHNIEHCIVLCDADIRLIGENKGEILQNHKTLLIKNDINRIRQILRQIVK